MKYIFALAIFLVSCGGALTIDDLLSDQDIDEIVDAGDIDLQDLNAVCEQACVKFDFLSCLEMMTKDMSIGDYLTDQTCEALCKKAASLYGGRDEGRAFKPECLLVGSCSGMVECFSK